MRPPGRRTVGLLLGAALLLVLGACAARPAPGGTLPSAVDVAGRSVPFEGLQPWTVASVPSRASTRLTVFAVGSEITGGGECGPPALRIHVRTSAQRVTVSVAGYQERAGADTACPSIGYTPGPHTIVLPVAIGDRSVVDASSGKVRALLVGTDYPDLVAPRGLRALPLGRFDPGSAVVRNWSEGDQVVLSLRTTTPTAARDDPPYGRIVRRTEVGGSPATLYAADGQSQLRWTPNDRQTITLGFDDSDHRHWTVEQRIALALAVTGYRTEGTGRLPQPSTPGTAAAVFSSADGPVHRVPELFKSSGVYIGVDCQGVGSVTVTLRGTAYPFACTAELRHHLAKSTGSAHEPFLVDVDGTAGVRWAVTLARASLDGS